MSPDEPKSGNALENLALFAIAIPVLGLFMGGVYSWPAMQVCKGREPWLTGLLAIGLAITLVGLGYLAGTPILYTAGGWVVSIVLLLLVRRLHGTLDGNLERFGIVHAAALLIAFGLAVLTRA